MKKIRRILKLDCFAKTLAMTAIAALLMLAGLSAAYAITYTGGSYDGYGSIASADVVLNGLAGTISSSKHQLFLVGQDAAAIATITITDTAGASITAANDLRIVIPSGLNMAWDATDTTAVIGGAAAGKVNAEVSYENSNKTLVLNVTSDFVEGDAVTVSGLAFTNFSAASGAPASLQLDINNIGYSYFSDSKVIQIIAADGVLYAGGSYDGAAASNASDGVLLSGANTDVFAVTHANYLGRIGENQAMAITAKDSDGVTLTGYSPATTVVVSKAETGGAAPDSATLSSTSLNAADFTNGAATVTLGDTEAENVTVTAMDSSTNVMTGTSLAVEFYAGGIVSYSLTATTPKTAGAGWTETITAKDSKNQTVTSDSTTEVTASTVSGNLKFYTDANYTTETTTYTLTNGVATAYLKTNVAENVSYDVVDGNAKAGASANIVVNPAAASKIVLTSGAQTLTAGAVSAAYTAQVQDQYNNLRSADALALTLASDSVNGSFSAAADPFSAISSVTTGSGAATFYYKDTLAGAPTITISRFGLTQATQGATINAGAASKAAIAAPASVVAGAVSGVFTITSTDAYGNTKAVVADTTLDLSSNSTGTAVFYSDAQGASVITSKVISAGASSAAFYYKDTKAAVATITATRASGDVFTEAATGAITVNPGVKAKLVFKQQPSAASLINNALAQQPIVAIQDTYGNQTADTNAITISASSDNQNYSAAGGVLTVTTNPLAAVAGESAFGGVRYNNVGTVYLYAVSGSLQPAFSTATVYSTVSDTKLEVSASPVSSFNISPINDTLAEKFNVLSFKITDIGSDGVPTQIDRIQIPVAGTGANASTDIAWAGLYQGATLVAESASIANNAITFGAAADNDVTADLYSVPDNTSKEFTVQIYMKPSKLTATEGQTYTFSINENNISTDIGGGSTGMRDNAGQVAIVTGTIVVTMTHLEVVRQDTGSSTVNMNAGATVELAIRATDANKNIDKGYINDHTFIFSGLSNIGNNKPKVEGVEVGYNNTVNFPVSPGGVSAANAATLQAFKAESAAFSTQELDQNYLGFPATVTVTASAGSASTVSSTSGNSQIGKPSAALANPLIATIYDTYGNPVQGVAAAFAIASAPDGASGQALTVTDTTSNASGQASTAFTFGNTDGAYQVNLTSAGLTGSPVAFTATAYSPSALNKVSGDTQSQTVALALANPLVVKLASANSTGIPNETVNFAITSAPDGASGQALSAASVVTNASGQASVTLTLGNKKGDYQVTASYPNLASDVFTATAVAAAPYRVTVSGPGSTTAGVGSGVFTVNTKDAQGNLADVSGGDLALLLSTSTPNSGAFYSDSACTSSINSITIAAGANTGSFYYKDTVIGAPTLTVERSSGPALTVSSATTTMDIVAAGLASFKVTGAGGTLAAGSSRVITVTAYDALGNVKTNLDSSLTGVFSGANSSPAPSSNAPTCSNADGSDIAFGANTSLAFTDGVATSTLKLYKAESVAIKFTDSPVTTASADDLEFAVKHNSADHLKFTADISATATVNTAFNLGVLNAVDLYSNLCDGANGATAYSGNKTIAYSLSGSANAPDGSATDSYVTSVSFTAGASTTALATTLYRAQTTAITANASDLNGTDVASSSVTVAAGAVSKLWFSQQPTTSAFTNVALPQQPIVAVADVYGNAVTSSNDQITLLASTTNDAYTAVTNGALSASSLAVTVANGVAAFSGVKYSYPEAVYLKAHSVGGLAADVYSYQVTFKVSTDTAIAAGALAEPETISSLACTDGTKAQVFDFKVTDSGGDGKATSIKQIKIARNTAADTTAGWGNYISGASISDGTTSMLGTVADDVLTFGSGASTIYAVADGANKTYTLSIYLKTSLPAGSDGKVMAFSVDPNDQITLAALSSEFSADAAAITGSTTIDVTATKFTLTGSSAAVAAGAGSTLTITAKDVNGNVDSGYEGEKEIIFSGATIATSGALTYNPTCTNFSTGAVDFGSITLVEFTDGVSSSTITMKLYKVESALIKAKTSDNVIATSNTDAFTVAVSGGAASKLSWGTQPVTVAVANAPWKEFTVAAVDTYGNTATFDGAVTVAPTGGTTTATATSTVNAVSGTAAFSAYTAYCAVYPGIVTLNATADGVTQSGASNNVTVSANYDITYNIKDSVNGSALSGITMNILNAATGQLVAGLASNPKIGNSPFSLSLPYGSYNLACSVALYVDSTFEKTPNYAADAADGTVDNKIAWTSYMTSIAESQADYKVLPIPIYDETADKITVTAHLEKRGKHIESDDINTLRNATLSIFDSTDMANAKKTVSLTVPDAAGYYYFNVADAVASEGFKKGRNYLIKVTIKYGGEDLTTNVTYVGVSDLTITTTEALSGIAANIAAVSADVTAAKTSIEAKVSDANTAIQAKVAAVKTETADILTAAKTDIPAKITSEIKKNVAPFIKSGILEGPTEVKSGDTLTIAYRCGTGLSPTIDVYNKSNVLKVTKQLMTEKSSGIYEYSVKFLAAWGEGKFTVVCSEATEGTVDAKVINVTSANLADVAGQVSAVVGSTSGLGSLRDNFVGFPAQFANMNQALVSINKGFTGNFEATKQAKKNIDDVFNQLMKMSENIKSFNNSTGVNLQSLITVNKDKKEDTKYIANTVEKMQTAVELSKKMIEDGLKKPKVESYFQFD